MAHQFDRPWVGDASVFEAACGPIPFTDHRDARPGAWQLLRGADTAGSVDGSASAAVLALTCVFVASS